MQQGRTRVQEAIDLLQGVVGTCHPMLFLKMGAAEWTPVGNESLYAVVPGKQGTAALVLCDMDGNSKVMSDWVASGQAEEYSRSLSAKGLQRFDGEVKLPI